MGDSDGFSIFIIWIDLKYLTNRCFVCREKADFYCKDVRMPICSATCKKRLNEMDGK